jgi:hypothetical protein
MSSTTTTIETNIPAERLVEAFVAAAGGAAGVVAVSEDGPTCAVGTASATGVLAGSAVAATAAGFDADFRERADDCVR